MCDSTSQQVVITPVEEEVFVRDMKWREIYCWFIYNWEADWKSLSRGKWIIDEKSNISCLLRTFSSLGNLAVQVLLRLSEVGRHPDRLQQEDNLILNCELPGRQAPVPGCWTALLWPETWRVLWKQPLATPADGHGEGLPSGLAVSARQPLKSRGGNRCPLHHCS